MTDQQVWVIVNEDGYYVNPKYLSLYTGLCTGFTYYNNKKTMQKDLDMLGGRYRVVYININDISEGERV